MVHEQVSVVGTCFQCGKGMTEAEGGKIFTFCSQCWPDNPIANQQTMQGLQARVKELENDLVDALDLNNGVGPSVMTALVNSRAEQQAKVERLVLGLTWMAGYIINECNGTPDTAGWIKEALKMADLQKKYQAEQRAHIERLQSEVERLKTISLCRCGDSFTAEDPGTCGNCLATYYQDRVRTGTVMAKVDR